MLRKLVINNIDKHQHYMDFFYVTEVTNGADTIVSQDHVTNEDPLPKTQPNNKPSSTLDVLKMIFAKLEKIECSQEALNLKIEILEQRSFQVDEKLETLTTLIKKLETLITNDVSSNKITEVSPAAILEETPTAATQGNDSMENIIANISSQEIMKKYGLITEDEQDEVKTY